MFTHSAPSDHAARASHWHSRIEANHPDFHSSRPRPQFRAPPHPLTATPPLSATSRHLPQSRCTGSVDVMLPFCCMLCNALFNVRVCWHIKHQVFVILDDDAANAGTRWISFCNLQSSRVTVFVNPSETDFYEFFCLYTVGVRIGRNYFSYP